MLLDSITSFATGTYTVTRFTPQTISNGRVVAGSTSTLPIVASVQPFSGRVVIPLPEGVRSEDVRVLFTATQLTPTDDSGPADIVGVPEPEVGGSVEMFYVWKVDGPWTMSGRTHYRAYVARRGRP